MTKLFKRFAAFMIGAVMGILGLPFMVAATADVITRERGSTQKIDVYPVAVDIIYKGTIVAVNAAGFLAPAADTAGLVVVGIAEKNVDNSGGSAGDLNCPVRSGVVVRLTSTSTLTQAMVGDTIYAEDDQTIGITADVSNDIAIGRIVEFVSTTLAWVWIPVAGERTQLPRGFLNVDLVSGGVAGNHTVTGIALGDEIVFVGHFSTLASIATLGDLTSEFSIDSADTIDNAAGTDTSSDQLMVFWIDHTR